MQHSEWLNKATSGDSPRTIGKRAGISFRTVTDQTARESLAAENVIKIAQAYKVHPVRALVDCGFLAADYAVSVDPFTALRVVSDDDLAEEVLRRMKVGGEHPALSEPADNVVTQLRSVADSSPDEDELRGRNDDDVP